MCFIFFLRPHILNEITFSKQSSPRSCLCPIKRIAGLYELRGMIKFILSQENPLPVSGTSFPTRKATFCFGSNLGRLLVIAYIATESKK